MNSSLSLHLLVFTSFFVCFLASCQESVENPESKLKPSVSHRTVKEKTVVVPPEVLRHWRAVRLVVLDKSRGTENIYTIPIGSTFVTPVSALNITVEAFLPDFIMQGTTITSSSNNLVNPSVKVRILENSTPVFKGWLFSKFPSTNAVIHPKYGFSLIGAIPARK